MTDKEIGLCKPPIDAELLLPPLFVASRLGMRLLMEFQGVADG